MMNIETKSYESLLPFLVVEAISTQGFSFNSMSVRMIDKGWAWLVSGRKLLIWKFKDTKATNLDRARRMLSPCFELQLPQSDLVHRADLIHVFFMPQNHNISLRATSVPAALVVSPEGTVRFWSSIANERFTESPAADLQGQEFCALSHLSAFEYILGTTTGLVYLLTIDVAAHDSKSMLVLSALNAPSSLLSGIGRRVTTLFFGPMVTDLGADTKRPLIAVPKYSQSMIEKTGTSDRIFFVMSSSFKLRQWSRTNEGIHSTNHLTREWDLQRNIYTRLISDLSLSETDSISFWPIDMITTKSKELLMLILTLDTTRGNAINYATCLFNPYQVGDSIANLTVLRSHTCHYSNESDEQLLSLRFLERRANSPLCFMYDKKFLFLVQVDQDILDAIDYGIQDDGIMGAGIVEDHPILFTQRDGLTYVAPVANNKSRMNETSIQLEHHPMHASRTQEISHSRQDNQRQIPTRVDPMLIEIDTDEDEETENQRSRGPNQSSLRVDENMNKSSVNKSLNQSGLKKSTQRRKGDDLDALLKENKEFEWIQQIDSKQYAEASQTLEKLAEGGEVLQDRKETLLALSKLAKLAA